MASKFQPIQHPVRAPEFAQPMGAWLDLALTLSSVCLFAAAAFVLMPLALVQPHRDRPVSLRSRKNTDNEHPSTANVYFLADFQRKR